MQVNSSNGSLQQRFFSGTGSIGGIHLPDFNDKYIFSKKKSGVSDKEYRKQIREQAYEDFEKGKLLDEYDMRGTNHVIISPETLSKMESDPAMKKSVLSKIEEFCSSESQKEIQALSPPVKSAGMIIYPDGSTLYWLEGYPNEIGNEKDKKIVNEMSISESFQKYSDTNYQATENNLESIMQIMATEYKRKSIS